MNKESSVKKPEIHGMIAEFDTANDVLNAARKAREAGYTRMDAYTPFPVHGLAEALNFKDTRISWIVFAGGFIGMMAGIALQIYVSVYDYPMNVGGRPPISHVGFIPVTFECTILLAAFGSLLGMLILNGLPRPHHPIFNAKNIERAGSDRFFLCIESVDPQYDAQKTKEFLSGLNPLSLSEVDDA